MHHHRVVLAGLSLIAVLTFPGCGDVPTQRVKVAPHAHIAHTDNGFRSRVQRDRDRAGTVAAVSTTTFSPWTGGAAALAPAVKYAAGARSVRRPPRGPTTLDRGVTPAAPSIRIGIAISTVLGCIKQHESGNYSEHSHLGSGSGAYQYIPSTWRAWSARAGYPGWPYAYLAPPAVQDAVTVYALTHGGAGNWSPRYGNDPCTVGMGG